MEYINTALELKAAPDDSGAFEGYASVFGDIDTGLDVVAPGAFSDSLTKRKPKMLWQHDSDKVIGVWDAVAEDAKGLHVKGRVLKDIALGREALTLLKEGAIDSMSIGYRTIEAEDVGRVRKLNKVDLFEVSLVTFPMLESAMVTAVKALETERDFERFLRDAGFTRKDAVAIALHGWKARQRDAVAKESDGLAAILQKLGQLQEKLNDRA